MAREPAKPAVPASARRRVIGDLVAAIGGSLMSCLNGSLALTDRKPFRSEHRRVPAELTQLITSGEAFSDLTSWLTSRIWLPADGSAKRQPGLWHTRRRRRAAWRPSCIPRYPFRDPSPCASRNRDRTALQTFSTSCCSRLFAWRLARPAESSPLIWRHPSLSGWQPNDHQSTSGRIS